MKMVELHKFRRVVEDMFVWRQCDTRALAVFPSLSSSWRFPYNRFAFLESSRTLLGKVTGQTISSTMPVSIVYRHLELPRASLQLVKYKLYSQSFLLR